MLDVCLIQAAIGGDKEDCPSPKFFVSIMLFQPWPYGISLAYIYLGQLTIFWRAYKDVDTGLSEFFTAFHCWQN